MLKNRPALLMSGLALIGWLTFAYNAHSSAGAQHELRVQVADLIAAQERLIAEHDRTADTLNAAREALSNLRANSATERDKVQAQLAAAREEMMALEKRLGEGQATAGVNVDLRNGLDFNHGGGYALGDLISGVENVVGSAFADTLIGDDGANRLTGGDGGDRLEAGGGRDTLIGGRGDDTYVVDGEGDRSVELAGGGTDTVEVVGGSSYALGDNLENLTYAGDYAGIARFTMTGNQLANVLTGGDGRDRISGGGGTDTLKGLEGDDRFSGGPGNDTFVFAPNFGNDVITDFDANPAGARTVSTSRPSGSPRPPSWPAWQSTTLARIRWSPSIRIRLRRSGSPASATRRPSRSRTSSFDRRAGICVVRKGAQAAGAAS